MLQIVSNDHKNPLVAYSAKNSNGSGNSGSDNTQPGNSERTAPLYLLGEKIITTSTDNGKRTLKCSGLISVTVGDTTASKEVNFTVQQSSDGKISVSVAPFQF